MVLFILKINYDRCECKPKRNGMDIKGTVVILSYPGKQILKTPIKAQKCHNIFKQLNKLECFYPDASLLSDFGMHEISVNFSNKFKIIIIKNLIMLKNENIIIFYSDHKERILKLITREIANKYYKEIIEFIEISKHLFNSHKNIKKVYKYSPDSG